MATESGPGGFRCGSQDRTEKATEEYREHERHWARSRSGAHPREVKIHGIDERRHHAKIDSGLANSPDVSVELGLQRSNW
mmetsp:Transcript_159122/g.296506  ORF Transcript_159122/g.296506 Transcript_159122/m.296506 type:complete len:80 (+) Transcript_159122:1170-1409(+)